jgi:UDP-N-acetylglucosamine--N-acetylmuramyl-(pentapeptide) pyrophosphoryl-undecaprenol N-acetylglucosamine transferase
LDGTDAELTGLPIRRVIGTASRQEAAAALGLDPGAPTVLVLGGSQGSLVLNRLMTEALGRITDLERRTWQVIHLTGPAGSREAQVAYAKTGLRCWVAPHLSNMEWAYALADLAVARCGASTMAELARCGVPAIVVPYPGASGHQRDNAKLLESRGAAVRLEQHDTTPGRLLEQLRKLLSDPAQRQQMRARMAGLARPDAAEQLASMIARVARPESDDQL